jgi:hypothetical protein
LGEIARVCFRRAPKGATKPSHKDATRLSLRLRFVSCGMCGCLKVSKAGGYAGLNRPLSSRVKANTRLLTLVPVMPAQISPAADNVVDRGFPVHQPDTAWVGDIPSVGTQAGWLYILRCS